MEVVAGTREDVAALLGLFDEAVAWLAARGQTGQWGSEPWSRNPNRVARAEALAGGGGLWFAVDGGERVGAIVLGAAFDYVPAPDVAELYVQVLLSRPSHRGRGVGALLVAHAIDEARRAGAARLRVDCWDGVPELPAQYERLGFTRIGSFAVGDWPGAILERPV